MNFQKPQKFHLCLAGITLAAIFLVAALAFAGEDGRSVFVLTSTNNSNGNDVVVFKLNTGAGPSVSWLDTLSTGGKGGASTNAGILQFRDDLGAVANWGSNTVSQLVRDHDSISIGPTIKLGTGCVNPDSVALAQDHLYVVDTVCAESFRWPWGNTPDGTVPLGDTSAAQIAVGKTWAAVTLSDGKLYQLPLAGDGALSGTYTPITLLSGASLVPLGEAFWGNVLGFTPAHDTDNFAIVNNGVEQPVPFPNPPGPYPANAPCWVAKGGGNIWYTGNSPGHAISIFFSDSQGGAYYKSIPLPGPPSDITVSRDFKWLAVIYTYLGEGYIAVYSIDAYGDLTYVATSTSSALPTTISGVAFSE
jgi:hypothetical protein